MQPTQSWLATQRQSGYRRHAAPAAVVAIAVVAAILLMSLFVDALHESIARGEDLRSRLAASTPSSAEPVEAVAQANLLMARR